MKYIRKLFVYLLVSALLLTGTFNVTSFAAESEDNSTSTVTLKDVIAGLADPSQINNFATRATEVNTVLEDGTYYLNGEYSGDYLKYNSTSPAAESGTFSALGSTIKWKITNVNDSFTIQPINDLTKYLAVPTTSTTSTSVQYVTVSGTSIPTECLWDISIATGGGCLVQNVYNSRYLYSYGSTVYTTSSLGSSDSSAYKSRVWRIAEISYISGRELDEDADFSTLILTVGNTGYPSITKSPTNAIWATYSDFSYSRQVTSHVTVSNGVFTANSAGVTTIIATHKVTNLKFVFAVIVGDQPAYTMRNYIDQGYRVRFGGYSNVYTYNSVVSEKFEQFFGLNCSCQYVLHTSSADNCKIDQFDSVASDNLAASCTHSSTHLTSTAMRDVMGDGSNVISRILWTGHILKDEANAGSFFSLQAIIVTPRELAYKVGSEYIFNTDLNDMLEIISWTLFHELSHQLGLPDHYCYGDRDAVTNKCSNPNCYRCNKGLEPPECTMTRDRYLPLDQCNPIDIYCRNCLITITAHLTDHH